MFQNVCRYLKIIEDNYRKIARETFLGSKWGYRTWRSFIPETAAFVPLRLFCELDFSGVVENIECYLVWKL